MTFIKGFFATLCFILLQLAVLATGIVVGGWLTVKFGSVIWFFVSFFAAIVISWAMYGGFFFGAAKKVAGHDR